MIEYLPYMLGSYVILSLTFFIIPIKRKTNLNKNPLFRKALDKKGILHISHRGGSREKLENTIEAFQNATDIQTNSLEMDVCFTKDKKVIVIHDSLLTRLCGVNKHTHEYNYDELPVIMNSFYLDFAHKQLFPTQDCKTKYFPLLDDVFKQFPQSMMNIEIKTPNSDINKAVNQLIIKHKREHLTIWGARKPFDSDQLYKLNPNIGRFFCASRVLKLYLQYLIGILPFCKIHEDTLQIPLYTRDYYQCKIQQATSRGQRVAVHIQFAIIKFLNVVSKPLFSHLRKRGVLVIYWVLNEEHEFQLAIEQGAHGIMTDNPTRLKQFLRSKSLNID